MTKRNSEVPIDAISKLVGYLYDDERLNYMGERNHIFRSVKRVAEWLDSLQEERAA
jgi:hypothetical protein